MRIPTTSIPKLQPTDGREAARRKARLNPIRALIRSSLEVVHVLSRSVNKLDARRVFDHYINRNARATVVQKSAELQLQWIAQPSQYLD